MGKIVLPPLKFILLSILSGLVFLTFSLIYHWGQWVSPSLELKNSLLIWLPSASYSVILPSVSSGLLFTFFSYRKTRINPVAAALTAAAAFFIIFSGFSYTASMTDNHEAISFQPFNERKLHSIDNGIIYSDSINENNKNIVDGILIRANGSDLPGFKYYQSAELIKNAHPELEIDEGRSIDITPGNPVFHETFIPGSILGSYIADIDSLNETFRAAASEEGSQFIILAAAMTAFLLACMLFHGATVWPLLDFILILGFHRIFYYLLSLFSRESDFINETLFGGRTPGSIPLFTLTSVTLIIFLFGILIRLTGRRRSA